MQFLDEKPSVPYVGKDLPYVGDEEVQVPFFFWGGEQPYVSYVGNEEAQVPPYIYVAILLISSYMHAHIQVLGIM